MKKLGMMMCLAVMSCFGGDWKVVEIEGDQFVALEEVGAFYGLDMKVDDEGGVVLKSRDLTLAFKEGAKEAIFNKVKFQLSDPVRKEAEGRFLSVKDLTLLVDPVLRPSKVSGLDGFQTVFLFPEIAPDAGELDGILRIVVERLETSGFKVVVLEDKGGGGAMSVENQLQEMDGTTQAVFLKLVLGAGKEKTLGTRTLGSKPKPSVAMSTGLHWSLLRRFEASKIEFLDQGISIGGKGNYDGLDLPGVCLDIHFGKMGATTKSGEVLGRSIADALLLTRKAATARAPKLEEK